jgi:alanine racemase
VLRPTVAIIDLDSIAHNYNQVKKLVGSNVYICPAVKADAYGHGAVEVSSTLIKCGAYMLSVATPEEAIELRDAGITNPILLLQTILIEQIPEMVEYDITAAVCALEIAEKLSDYAMRHGKKIKVHLKVDTGMGRIGVFADESLEFAKRIVQMKGLDLEGIFTHLPSADEDDLTYTSLQFAQFKSVCDDISNNGIDIPIKHVSNSAAIMNVSNSYFNMVRPGIMLYGHCDFTPKCSNIELRPALTLKSKVVFLKTLPAGQPVSYNRTYTTQKETLIATVPIGYADGYSRGLSNNGYALIHGVRVPIIGRICMDQLMLDITSVGDAAIGDEVVFYGKQGNETIYVDDAAKSLGTISYELLCNISKRVPRIYVNEQHAK